jgi:hypothetical protein
LGRGLCSVKNFGKIETRKLEKKSGKKHIMAKAKL